jgi:hypothetical protein
MTPTFHEFTLPAHWASALINDDWSGMDADEEDELLAWLDCYEPGYCVGCSDTPEFHHHHDATNLGVLGADCLTFTFQEV